MSHAHATEYIASKGLQVIEQALFDWLSQTTAMDAANDKMERTSEQSVRKLDFEQTADAAALSIQVAALSKGHGDDTRNSTAMGDLLQATIVWMGAELDDY